MRLPKCVTEKAFQQMVSKVFKVFYIVNIDLHYEQLMFVWLHVPLRATVLPPHIQKNGVLVLLLRGLRLQTFEDENYIPSEQRESWNSRICMFSWWVFMLDQKAVCCCLKTGWSAKHLAVPALNVSVLSLSSVAAAPHLLWFCDGLLISCLFRTVSSVLAQLRSAWRGPTSYFNPKS